MSRGEGDGGLSSKPHSPYDPTLSRVLRESLMCGLVGFTGASNESVIQAMTDRMEHRGPDDQGLWSDRSLSLGHRRLSILDLSVAGHQPMVSPDGRYVLAFNGEIYTHGAIRAELEPEVSFTSTSDTETLLQGLIQYGVQLLPRLNGIFAFAFYDRQTQELLLARDPLGVKPLYYAVVQGQLVFASELKSLLEFRGLSRAIDPLGIANYLTYLWSPRGRTPLEAVRKLTPGCYARIVTSAPVTAIEEISYYPHPLNGTRSKQTEAESIDALDRALQTAVQRQLLSDVPVGYFLSGGLDSSLLVAIARRLNPEAPIQAFTIDTTGVEATEGFVSDLDYARRVAAHLDVPLEVVDPAGELLELFDRVIWHLDEPQADPAPMNVLAICERARTMGYKVLIGGTAADDLFSGYRRHEALSAERWLRWLPPLLGRGLRDLSTHVPSRPALLRRIRKVAQQLGKSPRDRMLGYFAWIEPDRMRELLHPTLREAIAGTDPLDSLRLLLEEIPMETDPLNQMLHLEQRSFLVDHNLNYTDKLSMAVGVEVRVPYLDLDLVEWAAKLPPEWKMRGRVTKYLLRRVAERYLPHDVIYRPKAGFGGPVRKWILNDLAPRIADWLSPERVQARGLFDAEAVQRLIADNQAGRIDGAYTVWSLLAIESWCRQFVDGETVR